jgi:hypothetical protein
VEGFFSAALGGISAIFEIASVGMCEDEVEWWVSSRWIPNAEGGKDSCRRHGEKRALSQFIPVGALDDSGASVGDHNKSGNPAKPNRAHQRPTF